MHVAEKLADGLLQSEPASKLIRTLRLQHRTLAMIGLELREQNIVDDGVEDGVLVSAVSSVARKLIGEKLSRTIALQTKHVVTKEEIGDAWRAGQAAATAASAKLRGHLWEYEDDRHLIDVVNQQTNGHGTPWEDVAWFMQNQHGVKSNAKGCRMRYYKLMGPKTNND